MHLRGHGGAKASVRFVQAMSERLAYAARFDIKSYYESIDHRVLLEQLTFAQASPELCALVGEYLSLPDQRRSGRGMVAGGAVSPLLAALYLTPLDRAMERLEKKGGIRYVRFMDDFVIFAPTRWRLRAAICQMHALLRGLKLRIHPDKRFIGKTQKGFDLLGYHFRPRRKLQPALQSRNRLIERARRLHERGADEHRLRQYVQRWFAWLHGGLRARVGFKGGFKRIWVYVLKRLHLSGYRVRRR
jgi:RNA-directed DNA polymerase